MPHAGADILASLEDCGSLLQDELANLRAARSDLDTQIDELIQRRSAAIEDLAQHYLPELSEEAVGRTFRDVRRKLQDVLQRRSHAVTQLTQHVAQVSQQAAELKAELNNVTARLDQAVARRDELQEEVSRRLDADDNFRQLSSQVIQSEEQLAKYERQLSESRREADEKLPAYEASRLFQYLHNRHFDTSQYHAWGLIRALDRWVAKLIDYRRTKQSYDFLRTVPDLMATEVERHRELLQTASETLQLRQQALWRETGLDKAITAGETLGQQREELVDLLTENNQTLAQHQNELIAAEDKHGTYYTQALAEFQAMLEQLQTQVLDQRVKATPQDEDDAIAAEIRWLTEELETSRRGASDTDDKIRRMERQVQGMNYVLSKFRAAEFDAERSTFAVEFDIDRQLQRYRNSEINQFGLWRSLKRHQSFAPTWVEKTTDTAVDAMKSPAGQSLITAAGQIAAAALSVAVQKKMNRRGINLPKMGGKFTQGDGF